MAGQLEGRIALVTGAGSGIGAAIARLFREEGAIVAALGRRTPDTGTQNLSADVGDSRSLAGAVEAVRLAHGMPDIVVHAAAVCPQASLFESSTEQFADTYNVNLIGAVRLLQLCAPAMRERGHGGFILLSSINAAFATPSLAAYAASKAALDNLTKTAALELAPSGVRVNAIAPASVDTPMLRASFDASTDAAAARETNIARHPLGRLGTSLDIADLALFLASDRAGWITGAIHRIDGGAHVTRR